MTSLDKPPGVVVSLAANRTKEVVEAMETTAIRFDRWKLRKWAGVPHVVRNIFRSPRITNAQNVWGCQDSKCFCNTPRGKEEMRLIHAS